MKRSRRPAPTILVVAYRADEHLAACLATLGADIRVTVIDNDASPATQDVARTAGARYVASPSNIGFAAGVNLGLREAWDGETDVLLLNPDARLTPSDVAALQDALHAPGTRLAAVGPQLRGDDGASQRAAWPVPSPGQVWADAFGLSRFWRGTQFVVGAVLMLNGDALRQLGALDERYFLYGEEADWQLRAHRAGWSVAVVHDVVAVHAGSGSSADDSVRTALFHASGESFARRWYGTSGWWVIRAGALLAAGRRSLIGSSEARKVNRRTFALYLRGPLRARGMHGRVA